MNLGFLIDFLHIESKLDRNIDICFSIDSRRIDNNTIFVGIQGEKYNGSSFAKDAIVNGALLAIVDDKDFLLSSYDNCIYVKNSVEFLGILAKAWRKEVNVKVLAITGSSGKTTVKEMVSLILKHSFGDDKVLTTIGNLNNHIGVPLTLLKLQYHHQYAVIEMGMNHFGELAYLSNISLPNFALINNIQRAHIGCDFKNLDDIAKAKSEIFVGLQDDGIAILPKQDKYFKVLQEYSKKFKQITFGFNSDADIYISNLVNKDYSSEFLVHYHQKATKVKLPLLGEHNIYNCLASISLVVSLPIDFSNIGNTFNNFQNIDGRFNIINLRNNIKLIDDAYNANPDSVKASLNVLAKMSSKNKCFVFGDMGELGNYSQSAHEEIGEYAKKLGIEKLLCVGKFTKYTIQSFGNNGIFFKTKKDLIDYLDRNINFYSIILVKASNFMQMKDLVDFLKIKYKG